MENIFVDALDSRQNKYKNAMRKQAGFMATCEVKGRVVEESRRCQLH